MSDSRERARVDGDLVGGARRRPRQVVERPRPELSAARSARCWRRRGPTARRPCRRRRRRSASASVAISAGSAGALKAIACGRMHRVRVGVDQVERAAQHVADLVVERRPPSRPAPCPTGTRRTADRRARRRRAGRPSRWAATPWMARDALHRQRGGDRVVARCVQRLDAVGEGVERRGPVTPGGRPSVSSGS